MYADDDERVIAVLGIFHEVRDGRIPSPKFGPALRILKRPIPSVLPCLAHTLVKISKKHPKITRPFSCEIGFNLPIKNLFWIEMVSSSNLIKDFID